MLQLLSKIYILKLLWIPNLNMKVFSKKEEKKSPKYDMTSFFFKPDTCFRTVWFFSRENHCVMLLFLLQVTKLSFLSLSWSRIVVPTMSAFLKVWSEDDCSYMDYEDEDEFFLVNSIWFEIFPLQLAIFKNIFVFH